MPELNAWRHRASAQVSKVTDRAAGLLPKLGLDENTLRVSFTVVIGIAVSHAVLVFATPIDLVQAGSLTAVAKVSGFGGRPSCSACSRTLV